MANALSKDHVSGTAAGAASSAGWTLPMSGKTGTTESHRSSGFLGFTNQYAAANYVFDDSPTPSGLCSSPLRECSDGDLYGGTEPARTWFAALTPIAEDFGPIALPPTDPRYVDGGPGSQVPSVAGLNLDAARKKLTDSGFQVAPTPTAVYSSSTKGSVVGTTPTGKTIPGSIVTINTSLGYVPHPCTNRRPQRTAAGRATSRRAAASPPNVLNIPGLPPIVLPWLAPPPPPPPA